MRFLMIFLLLITWVQHSLAKNLTLTPDVFASFMAKSLEGSLPQTFKYKEYNIVVNEVSSLGNKVTFRGTTKQSKEIIQELYKYKTLPDELKKQCSDFSKVSMVDKGIEYLLHVEDGKRVIEVIYDKDACSASFDPTQRVYVDGYNHYGIDRYGEI